MIDYTNMSSFNDGYKIILIDNVENLNLNSVNALLKIIEEPKCVRCDRHRGRGRYFLDDVGVEHPVCLQ